MNKAIQKPKKSRVRLNPSMIIPRPPPSSSSSAVALKFTHPKHTYQGNTKLRDQNDPSAKTKRRVR